MQFSIRQVEEDGLVQVILKEEGTATEVAVLPGHGATLHGFRIRGENGESFDVIDGYKDREDLEKNIGQNFKGPKLSPWPCRLNSGKYSFDGKDYQLKNLFGDGQAIHGLLYNKRFTILEEKADDSMASVSMEYHYTKEDGGYPFDYCCEVRYVLHPEGVLEVTTNLTNKDRRDIPIADGWHPYFALGGSINDWQLQFHASAIVEFNEKLLPTGQLLQFTEFESARAIGDYFLDNCFSVKPGLVGPACELFNPANGLRVSFFPDKAYPYLQIYTPSERRSVAVENLSGAPDCFNNKMGLIVLAPGHSQIFTTKYKVSVGQKN